MVTEKSHRTSPEPWAGHREQRGEQEQAHKSLLLLSALCSSFSTESDKHTTRRHAQHMTLCAVLTHRQVSAKLFVIEHKQFTALQVVLVKK